MKNVRKSIKLNDMESRMLKRKEQMMVKGGRGCGDNCKCDRPSSGEENDTIWVDVSVWDFRQDEVTMAGDEKPFHP